MMSVREASRGAARDVSPKGLGAWIAMLVCLVAVTACLANAEADSVLFRHAPLQVQGFDHPERLTDGAVPADGAAWNGPLTTTALGPASVTFDLGGVEPIDAVWLQADHNDEYVLSVSNDGRDYRPLWAAPAVSTPGLRTRHAASLGASGRYVRLEPRGGDGAFSLSELLLFQRTPSEWPPTVRRVQPEAPASHSRWHLGVATALALLWLLLLPARASARLVALTISIPAGGLLYAAPAWLASWPPEPDSVSAVRGAAATLCVAALVKMLRELGPPVTAVCRWTVAISAVVAVLSFFHFGRPQFHDQGAREPSFLHFFDMRVYFPQAKYFDELGFDGVYAASVGALVDDDPNTSLRTLQNIPIRDLRDHRVVRIGDVKDHIVEVRGRFTHDRWESFVEDMRYFRQALGVQDYLRSLLDHGGNATPPWLANAKLLFSRLPVSRATLTAGALLDPLLLVVAFGATAHAFGLMPALVCALVFGANDYHMGGNTNWVGATLRHDWLASLLLGVAALGKRRFFIGGALLGLSTMLRAFPALVFAGVAARLGFIAFEHLRGRRERSPRPGLFILAGGGTAALVLAVYSALVLTPWAWAEWLHKVQLLSGEAHPNHISLKLLFSYNPTYSFESLEQIGRGDAWQAAQALTLQSHAAVFYLTAGAMSLLVLRACRTAPWHHAALLGLLLVVIWLYPANYYLHFFCALPLLAEAPRGFRDFRLPKPAAVIWVSLGGLCALQYLTLETPYVDLHYVQEAVLTFATLPVVLLGLQQQATSRRAAAPVDDGLARDRARA